MDWLLYTLLAIIARSTYSLATRVLSRGFKVSSQTQSLLLTTTLGLMAILVSPLLGGIDFGGVEKQILPVIVIILASAFGNVFYFKGQTNLDTGVTQVAFSSILIWGTILSLIFLGSKFSLQQILGLGLMLIAIVSIQRIKKGVRLDPNIGWIIISALLFALYQVASASVSTTISTATYLVLTYFGTALVILVLFFKNVKNDLSTLGSQVRNSLWKVLFASGTSLLYATFAYLAYGSAPNRGIPVVLLTSQVVLSVILGIIFLKEKENMGRKILAGCLAFLAGILIKS